MVSVSNDILTFAYRTKQIFSLVKLITSYRARDLADKDGNLVGDTLMLTDDERDLFDLIVNKAAMTVCDELMKLNEGDNQMFIIDNNRLIFNIVNHKKYNVNALQSCDTAILDLLNTSCVQQFYDIINQTEQSELYKVKSVEAAAVLHERAYELRKIR
ncbi:MAG: hypothetical protein LBF04_06905 [Prevotellaceae bacterium]|jgi:hypothetical protein|nr:hypothetical protein [Prevotellaceae bacterium]